MLLAINQVMPAVGISPYKPVRPEIGISPGALDQSRLELPGWFDPAVWLCADRIKDLVADYGLTGYAGLMAGVIWQARADALAGDQEAIDWLRSADCLDYCQAVGFNSAIIRSWLINRELKKGINRDRSCKLEAGPFLPSPTSVLPVPVIQTNRKVKND